MIKVTFTYYTGLAKRIFKNPRLLGSWNNEGYYTTEWSAFPMDEAILEDGCPGFTASCLFHPQEIGKMFHWGVIADSPEATNQWIVVTETQDHRTRERHRSFFLENNTSPQQYHFTYCRQFGCNKRFFQLDVDGNRIVTDASITFRLWAPHAQSVRLVFGNRENGFINDKGEIDGTLQDPLNVKSKKYCLKKVLVNNVWNGIWSTDDTDQSLRNFTDFDHEPYMFEVIKDDGTKAYRSDIYSRCQIGSGDFNPLTDPAHPMLMRNGIYIGHRTQLDGTVSCSVVIDPDKVTKYFREVDASGNPVWPEAHWVSSEDFWKDEINFEKPLPTRIEDLIIYELHVNGLGYGKNSNGLPLPGDLEDAINFLDYLEKLGVNCIELMPLSEYQGNAGWGYGTSHFFSLEYSAGGRDQYKHFIKACHQRGIAVILDVVYNHYHHHAERAQWLYDSNDHNKNIYYWYEGNPEKYAAFNQEAKRRVDEQIEDRCYDNRPPVDGHGGYIDNMSTAYAPCYWSEFVRQQFISSAAAFVTEFHIDGFRVDQVTSIHDYPILHANTYQQTPIKIPAVNHTNDHLKEYGRKFLREINTTLKLIKHNVFLIAEDHSHQGQVTQSINTGGFGFDATWYAEFYHQLIGDSQWGNMSSANLIRTAGKGDNNEPLALSNFVNNIYRWVNPKCVVYNESHDEAGNGFNTMRTICAAVNGKDYLNEQNRPFAEARCKVAFGLTLLSPGVPMFFMGEEIGADKIYRYYSIKEQRSSMRRFSDGFLYNRQDFFNEHQNKGRNLFRFYQDLIKCRCMYACLRYGGSIVVIHTNDNNKILAFIREYSNEQMLIIISLNNVHFASGYSLFSDFLGSSRWTEVFNSNSVFYGGDNVGNSGNSIHSVNGELTVVIPANSVTMFVKPYQNQAI